MSKDNEISVDLSKEKILNHAKSMCKASINIAKREKKMFAKFPVFTLETILEHVEKMSKDNEINKIKTSVEHSEISNLGKTEDLRKMGIEFEPPVEPSAEHKTIEKNIRKKSFAEGYRKGWADGIEKENFDPNPEREAEKWLKDRNQKTFSKDIITNDYFCSGVDEFEIDDRKNKERRFRIWEALNKMEKEIKQTNIDQDKENFPGCNISIKKSG